MIKFSLKNLICVIGQSATFTVKTDSAEVDNAMLQVASWPTVKQCKKKPFDHSCLHTYYLSKPSCFRWERRKHPIQDNQIWTKSCKQHKSTCNSIDSWWFTFQFPRTLLHRQIWCSQKLLVPVHQRIQQAVCDCLDASIERWPCVWGAVWPVFQSTNHSQHHNRQLQLSHLLSRQQIYLQLETNWRNWRLLRNLMQPA